MFIRRFQNNSLVLFIYLFIYYTGFQWVSVIRRFALFMGRPRPYPCKQRVSTVSIKNRFVIKILGMFVCVFGLCRMVGEWMSTDAFDCEEATGKSLENRLESSCSHTQTWYVTNWNTTTQQCELAYMLTDWIQCQKRRAVLFKLLNPVTKFNHYRINHDRIRQGKNIPTQ